MPDSAAATWRPSAVRLAAAAPLLAALLAGGGCVAYTARPLDFAAHREAFTARSAEHEDVAAFARSLASDDAEHPPEFDAADGLSLAEAEVVALVFNADLRLARLAVGVARATAETAGLWEDPTLGVDVARVLAGGEHPWKLAVPIGLTLPLSGRLDAERVRAGAALDAELARVHAAEWATRIALRRAWARWSAEHERAALTAAYVGQTDRILSAIDRLEEAGEMSRIEARLFRVEAAVRRAELAQIRAAEAAARLGLLRLMGLAPDTAIAFQPSGVPTRRADVAELVALLDPARSPGVVVAAAEYEVAERTLATEVRRQYPDVHIGSGYGREDGADELLFGVQLPLPLWNRNRRGVAEADAGRELARAAAEVSYETAIAELAEAVLARDAAGAHRRSLEEEIAPMVDLQHAESLRLVELGEVNTLVLLASLSRQHDTKLRLLDSRRDEALAAVRIDEILGPEPTPRRRTPLQRSARP